MKGFLGNVLLAYINQYSINPYRWKPEKERHLRSNALEALFSLANEYSGTSPSYYSLEMRDSFSMVALRSVVFWNQCSAVARQIGMSILALHP